MKDTSIIKIPGLSLLMAVSTLLPVSTFLTLTAFLNLTSCSMNDEFLPSRLGPWSLTSDTTYTHENLYDYINGGAELYISYGFRKVYSKTYIADNQPNIIVDVFDMNSPKDAYGVFMYSAEEVSELVGQGTQYNEGFMLFWMDHYFVSIMSYPETPESKEAVVKIARTLENWIGRKGELPGILDYLPSGGLDKGSIRYFHNPAWLNSHYYIAGENILLIDDNTDALLARYNRQDHQSILLIIEYPSGEKAGEAYENFVTNYLPDLQGNSTLQVEDGTYTGMDRMDNILILVFNAAGGSDAEELMNQVQNNIKSSQK